MVTKSETVKKDEKPALDVEEEIPLPEHEEQYTENVPEDIPSPHDEAPVVSDNGITPVTQWSEIIGVLRKTCPIIAGVLGDSKAYIEGDRLLIDTNNSQFKTLVNGNNSVYRDSIRKAAEAVLGRVYKLGPYHAKSTEEKTNDPLQDFAARLKSLENN